MRALVTGGSGYFGSVLVRALRARGYAVRVLDVRDAPDRPPEVPLVLGDIRDEAAVARACAGVEVVHHSVAEVPLAKDRARFFSVNVEGTRTLLAAARRSGVEKTVIVSSSAVFGVPRHNPVRVGDPPKPEEDYGRAKLAAEELARRAADLDVTIVRPRTILGRDRLGIFQILFEWVYRGKPVYLLGGGDNRYQFVHCDDLADACVRAGERAGPATFHIGAERFGSMREALAALVLHAGTGSRLRSLPFAPTALAMRLASAVGLSPLSPYHALMYGREMYFDTSKAREELGWRPRFGNDEMLIESYERYVAERAAILSRRGASQHRSPVALRLLKLLEYLP